ncbi:LbtU family siderophore porin [Thermodesulfobacteriota bacterium]
MDRIGQLEKVVAANKDSQTKLESKLTDTSESPLGQLNDKVSLSGVIEVEAASSHEFDNTDSSDIALATVELGIDAAISQWSNGHILLKYEDGANLDVDEGTITLGNSEKHPLYLTGGKMYVPFGNFASNMLSDPLTLELGEANENALLLGFEREGFHGSVYGFNGDVEETGQDDMVRGMGANLGFGFAGEHVNFDAGFGWISNIADSDGLTDGLTLGAGNDMDGQVGGLTAYLAYHHNDCGLIAEYLTATDAFAVGELAFNGQGAEPSAWNLELSHISEIMGYETTFAVGYQASDEAVALGLAESRYLGSVGVGLMDYTSLAFEYVHAEDYELSDGGTGNDAQSVTMQLAVEF